MKTKPEAWLRVFSMCLDFANQFFYGLFTDALFYESLSWYTYPCDTSI